MIVRAARTEDAAGMARVMVDTFLAAHKGQMPEEVWTKRRNEWTYEVSERAWLRTLREIAESTNPLDCIYVAVDEVSGEVVGLAMGSPAEGEALADAGEVCALYVQKRHQRCGLGRRLVQAVAAHLAQTGMSALVIHVLAANAPARRFYEALGGRVVGEGETEDYGVMLPEVIYGWADIQSLVAADSTGEVG